VYKVRRRHNLLVFEGELDALKTTVITQNYKKALRDLPTLIQKVENKIADGTITNPQIIALWNDTRHDLKHCMRHLLVFDDPVHLAMGNNSTRQHELVMRRLNSITTI
jgi:hypothetical protein